uniref:Chloride channel protein n=1 Tax=Panagrolaimus sp. JU765 TaxID=591449 RepID=A0AC34QAI3_9BILA
MMDIIHQQKMPGIFFARYFLWVAYTVILVIGSAVFVHYVAPQAIGSGIPEMKTILRGVMLKEYLSFRTLISKVVGLTLSLGSGLPIGKEGPFVHVASVVANLLSHLVASFNPAYVNESRSAEMLAAGCAVGVACTFSAPVGGVLFSIEVTSVYFAVRNYWRAFFAATCAAAVFRLLRYFTSEFVTVVAFCQTTFVRDSFLPTELPIFALIGPVFCNDDIRQHWTIDGTESPFITLSSFLVVFYFLTAIASTLPIPCGIFGPSYIIGGCIGRLTGEIVAYSWDRTDFHIYPGVYAVVGAAAFCGGVTHTVSVAVIVFELTGQIVYILPVMVSFLGMFGRILRKTHAGTSF